MFAVTDTNGAAELAPVELNVNGTVMTNELPNGFDPALLYHDVN